MRAPLLRSLLWMGRALTAIGEPVSSAGLRLQSLAVTLLAVKGARSPRHTALPRTHWYRILALIGLPVAAWVFAALTLKGCS